MQKITASSPSTWIKPLAQIGLSAKGVVYCLTGILTLMIAFSIGVSSTKDADKGGVFKIISEQPLGKVILAIIALGLVCYSAWRFIMAIKDTEHKGTDAKGWAQRIVYFFSGAVYISIAFVAMKIVFKNKQSNGDSRQELASELLDKPFGMWWAAVVALAMVAVGIKQIHRAVSGKYRKYIEEGSFDSKAKSILIKSGQVGYIARGIVWLIVGWLFLKAAMNTNAKAAGNTGEAFKWLHSSIYGDILLALVSLGLICYGVFMFLRAKYQPIHSH